MNSTARIALVAVLLTVLVGTGQATVGTDAPAVSPAPVPVVGATVVCPDAAGAVAAGAAGLGPGALVWRPLDGQPREQPVPGAGTVVVGPEGPLVVSGSGAVAAGLAAEQVARGASSFTGVRCAPPSTSSWFLGGATVAGNTTELVLINLEEGSALLDVTLWSTTGPTDRRPGRGVVVPARSRVSLPLERLAPGRDLLAVQVQTSRGRVAAALRHVSADGRVPFGADWVPASGPPAREVVVPGLPAGTGRRLVVVSNPGRDDALVTIELVTADGRLVPDGLEAVPVPAGTSVARDVSTALTRTPAAARVRSDGPPVLAAALVDVVVTAPARELAWAGAAGPVTGAALLPSVASGAQDTLLLTAVAVDAVVDLVAVPVLGASGPLPEPRRVTVPAGTTAALSLSGDTAYEVRPISGTAYAARHLRAPGRGTTILPVVAAASTVPRPAVSPDPLAGSGR